MMFTTRGEILVCLDRVFRRTRFTMTVIDVDSFPMAVQITWKGMEYKIDLEGTVYEIRNFQQCETDRSTMLQGLIKYENDAG